MVRLSLIPVINVLEVHDAVMREYLSGLEDDTITEHLEYPFRLVRFFPENARHALANADNLHDEILSLFNLIDAHAVFLDISTDFNELENKYNKRLVTPHEFWLEYYEKLSQDISGPAMTLYRIYMNEIIEKNIRLIENKERLPLNILFYGSGMRLWNEIFPVYEEAFNMVEEFTLQIARALNEIMNLREKPKFLWNCSFNALRAGISYEETEKFYDELICRIQRLLEYKVREHFVKSLRQHAKAYVGSYEKFIDIKIKEDKIKFLNIADGLKILRSQSEISDIIILCDPMDYNAILDFLKHGMEMPFPRVSIHEINMTRLFSKMKPFIQKNRIMQINYEIGLDIIGREKSGRYECPDAILVPA